MRRLPVAAFVVLAVATVAAFFVTQHLKVTTPILAGDPAPSPAAINPIDGQVCKGKSHRRMFISFYLLNRSDDVDVEIVNASDAPVATLAYGVHMQGGSHPKRGRFFWDGRTSNGVIAPDGVYYVRVALIHQARSVLISNSAGPEAVTIETVPPRPRVTGVSPAIVPERNGSTVTIDQTGTAGAQPRVLVYRTDLPGGPRLVKTFVGHRGPTSVWDGTINGRPAPQGTYLIGLKVTDQACNSGRFPAEFPPVAGTTNGAGTTVRYLAAEPPLTPIAAGSTATVFVDARQHTYHWALRRPLAKHVLAAGMTSDVGLRVPVPADGPGLYELELHYGTHRTVVPLVASSASGRGGKVLVVLPALRWQGVNPVDDDRDGIPNTLTAGYPVDLNRPLVNGLPADWHADVALLTYLRRHHLGYELTTDLALATHAGLPLTSYAGVILAGNETWVPSQFSGPLRSYVAGGGHVLSLGIDSLRRSVTLTSTRASSPSAPAAADVLGAHVGAVSATKGNLIIAGRDELHLFRGGSGTLHYPSFQAFTGLAGGLQLASEAGVSPATPAVIGYRSGRGIVIDVGLPGFSLSLAHNLDGQQLLSRIYRVLAG